MPPRLPCPAGPCAAATHARTHASRAQLSAGLIFGNVALLIQSFDSVGTRFRERMEAVNAFIRFHELPAALAERIRRHVEYLWNLHHGLDVQATLAELPGNLRTEVMMHLQADVVQRASLFKHCAAGFVKRIGGRLRPPARPPVPPSPRQRSRGRPAHTVSDGRGHTPPRRALSSPRGPPPHTRLTAHARRCTCRTT